MTAVIPTDTPTSTATPSPQPTNTPSPTHTATPFVCNETSGQMITGEFPSLIQNTSQPYRIYLPPCYEQTGRLYPALYLFHGNIYTESHWDDIGIDEAANDGIAAGQLPPFIIVLPFGGEIANNTSGGDRSFEGVVLNELIPYIEDQYCVWNEPEGRAIGGLSRGGYWSLEIAFRHPELFSSVGGHSAAIFEDNAGPIYNPLTTGLDPKLIGLPIYMDIGEQDWLREGVIELHAAMSEAGIPHEWHLNQGEHSDAYWTEHSPEYLAWYASHWPAAVEQYPSSGDRSCSP
jgi:enterochelin esterase-like enzyme